MNLKVRRFKLSDEKNISLKGFKIVLLSDLHGRTIGKDQNKLVNKILKQDPHIVIMAGDMIDAYDKDAKAAVALAKGLAGKVSVIAVRGNHFYSACKKAQKEMEDTFAKAGVNSLKNQREIIQFNECRISIDGLDDPIANAEYRGISRKEKLKRNRATIKTALEKMQSENAKADYSILVCHRPTDVDLFEKSGYDLSLAGHTHGGQWALPFGIEVIGDEASFFPPINMQSGLHYHNKMPLIITSGIGYSNVKLRTFLPPEIVVIEFK